MVDVDFLETPRFTGRPSFDYQSVPAYRIDRVRTVSGRLARNLNWQYALRRFIVTIGPRAQADVQYVLNFWHATGGGLIGFRVRDDADYKSCQVQQTPSAVDQPLVEIGTSGTYQLYKDYVVGSLTT